MRHGLIVLFYLCFACFATTAQAQLFRSNKPKLPDSLFIKNYLNRLNISTGVQINNVEFILAYPQFKQRFDISPKVTMQQFFKLEFRQINLRYSYSLFPLTKKADAPTNFRKEFGFSFGVKKFDFDLSFQNARGYFLRNSEEVLAGTNLAGQSLQFPNLRTRVFALQVSYNTNSQFSLNSLSTGKELQIRNAYSFLPGTSFYRIHFFQEDQTPQPGLSSDDYIIDWNLNLPLAATIVLPHNWYLTGIAGPILGVSFLDTKTYDPGLQKISDRNTRFTNGYYLRAGLGFTGQKWFGGIEAYNTRYGSASEAGRNTRFFYGAKFYVGLRLRPPKILKQTAEILPYDENGLKLGKKPKSPQQNN